MTRDHWEKGQPMRVLMITAAGAGNLGNRPAATVLELARTLSTDGHDVSVLHLKTSIVPTRWRGVATGAQLAGIDVCSVYLPPLRGTLRRSLPMLLRRILPRALRSKEIPRPDLMLAAPELVAATAAQVLGVQSGVPHLVVAQDRELEIPKSKWDREVLGHALQEAIAVGAIRTSQQELRRHWFLPTLEALPDRRGPGAEARALTRLAEQALERASGPRMIFHAPYALAPAPTSASRLRPNQMLEGFTSTGHRVHLVTGDPAQRRRDFADLRRRQRAGQNLAFAYSENSTQPNLLSTSAFHGLAPFLEARLLAWCAGNRIPFGQFYRDVYWRFAEKQASVAPLRRLVMQLAYRFDLAMLRVFGAHFFLPSLRMAPIIPAPLARCSELPPGAQIVDSAPGEGLRLLYVGGVGPGHEVDECLAALRDVEGAHLTMVVPRPTWESNRDRYLPLLTERVRVVHAGADELADLYAGASACLLFVEPNQYRDFAVPMKLYEYLGNGKPILASRGTLAGAIVDDLGIGFTAPNERAQIASLLTRLLRDSSLLESRGEHARRVRLEQTWSDRARTVAVQLVEGGKRT